MDLLPISLRIATRQVLVVGGGAVAQRKAQLLLRAGARVRLVAPRVRAELKALLPPPHEILERQFLDHDIDAVVLVVAATDDQALNERVHHLAVARQVLVNVVDQPALCTFIFPAIVDRSPLLIAVSSGGATPVLTRLLRARLETLIPSAYGSLAALMGRYRAVVKERLGTARQRLRFWESVVNGPVAELTLSGQPERAARLLEESLQGAGEPQRGEVYLVGAGPGDPDLLTFRALRLMQQADVVLYDRLVAPSILALTRQDADKIHVGKQRAQHTLPQEEISQLLVRLAQEGKRVLRLKGGDPFIFGRGGEEIQELAAANIPFQIVPGITAASGCASYAGIPLTHRDYAQSVRFVTGHLKDGSCDLDWPQLVQPGQTLVFYMGLLSLPLICQELIKHGASPALPIALIQQGTLPEQKVYIGTLATLAQRIAHESVKAPTLIIVGEVVRLHETLAWRG
ncbi:MAG: siroheme synthase CysG [Pseudomonadales bacterium]|jgi:uroporphyrin-III C-methyltransferase/precorrin-2 dehydrogenase/sirohydrochlorin ferrochelatase|nr:siroheme synthase CysG [Pseudomonadales bacterium]